MLVTDVLVVGGGPAGLAAAIAARARGIEALVVDLMSPPIDKACGEGLLPDGVRLLNELGVEIGRDEAVKFHGVRFIADGAVSEGRFRDAAGLGVRRPTLHQRMIDRAVQMVVTLRWKSRVGLGADMVATIDGEVVGCKWIIGADGYDSRVRKWAGIATRSSRSRIGIRQHYRVKPWTDLVEVHWHDAGQAYVTPVGRDEVSVALLGCRGELRPPQLPALFPELAKRLGDAMPSTSPRGSVSSSITLRGVTSGVVALVGDASGTVDSITGEGLSLALTQAIALADAMAREDLSIYGAAHRRICRMPKVAARILLMMNDHGFLRRRALKALAMHQPAFSQFLAVHSGAIGPMALGFGNLAGFAWNFLASGT